MLTVFLTVTTLKMEAEGSAQILISIYQITYLHMQDYKPYAPHREIL
jgi:hypothetical protein